MKQEQVVVLGIGIVLVALAAYWEARAGLPKKQTAEITTESLLLGDDRPRIWLFYNTSDVNSRQWYDFGARSSRVINIPILNTLYERIVMKNGNSYKVEVIGGVQDLVPLLGADELPQSLLNPRARVSTAEEDWIRAAILAKYGGLWLSPSVVCVKGFGELPPEKTVFFGEDTEPMYTSKFPGFRAVWAPKPGDTRFQTWADRVKERLETQMGGYQIRGDAKADWAELFFGQPDIVCDMGCELRRNPRTRKVIELEDLFAAGTEGRLPFTIPDTTTYIPIPYEDLLNRRHFGWILRTSETQLLQSDLVLTHILKST
jgi:hypothetical protein